MGTLGFGRILWPGALVEMGRGAQTESAMVLLGWDRDFKNPEFRKNVLEGQVHYPAPSPRVPTAQTGELRALGWGDGH